MAEDYAKHCNSPRSIELDGTEYELQKASPRDIGDILAWIKSQTTNPKELARDLMQGFSDAVQIEIWRTQAAIEWPPDFGSREGQELLNSSEGMARVLYLVLRRCRPAFTLEAARTLSGRIGFDQYLKVQAMLHPGEVGDPKALAQTSREASA